MARPASRKVGEKGVLKFFSLIRTPITFDGIAPSLRFRNDLGPTVCPDGRVPELYRFVRRSFSIESLYFFKTRRLSASGNSEGDIHQTWVYESFTLIRSTFTH